MKLTKAFWDKYFEVYDYLNLLIPYKDLLNSISDELDIKDGDFILDAGSGTGNLSVSLLDKNKNISVTSLDSSSAGLNIHRSKKSNASIILSDLTTRLPFPDNHFDKICSNNVLYTIPLEKRLSIIMEFNRVLKPSGKIVLSNLSKNFNPSTIYIDHIKKYYSKQGLVSVFSAILRLLIPTIRLFYYNYLIKNSNRSSPAKFFEKGEQAKLLISAGFKEVSEDMSVYANQALMNSAKKY